MKYTDLLCTYLEASGETWESFARRAGVSRAALYKTLKGKQNPRISSVEKLLAAAGYELTPTPVPECLQKLEHVREAVERRGKQCQGW